MGAAERHGAVQSDPVLTTVFQNFLRGLDAQDARIRLCADIGDMSTVVQYLRSADLTERTTSQEAFPWSKIVNIFLMEYKLGSSDDRAKIEAMLCSDLSVYQQIVLMEVVWKNTEGSDRNQWLGDLLHGFARNAQSNQERKKDFGLFVRTSPVFPKEIKDSLRQWL